MKKEPIHVLNIWYIFLLIRIFSGSVRFDNVDPDPRDCVLFIPGGLGGAWLGGNRRPLYTNGYRQRHSIKVIRKFF